MKIVDHYAGSELKIFSHARHWKAYYRNLMRQYLVGDVLEVGAGIGATTRSLCDGTQRRWICLEPDATLSTQIEMLLKSRSLPRCCKVITGRIAVLKKEQIFDAVLYIDVLEHIQDDRQELQTAVAHLRPGGVLIILAPAHQWLFTPFDKQIGHYRRYSKQSLLACVPQTLTCVDLRYLDSIGLLASAANAVILRSAMPSQWQIKIWDTFMIPASQLFDRMFGSNLGRSILGIWRKR
jgi:SAM-dependent methyltransferase